MTCVVNEPIELAKLKATPTDTELDSQLDSIRTAVRGNDYENGS